MVYNTEKTLKEHRDKVSSDDAQRIEEALSATKKAMEGTEPEAVNKALETLTEASHKLAEAMYKAASAQPGDGAGAGPQASPNGEASDAGTNKKDDVVDAEFVDVDDKGKS
jgi:molecular chaperone DnaK